MEKILVADDDRLIVSQIKAYLEQKGYFVLSAYDGQQVLETASVVALDAIILDVKLPDKSGLDICMILRSRTLIPILFVSAMGEEKDFIGGFSAGGDDYLSKPFSLAELEARLRRRIENHAKKIPFSVYRYGKLTVDTGRRKVFFGEREGDLTVLEFDLLAALVSHPDRVFSYEQLYGLVWQMPVFKSRHSIQVCVARLREKLSDLCGALNPIQTVSRKGYVFVSEALTRPLDTPTKN